MTGCMDHSIQDMDLTPLQSADIITEEPEKSAERIGFIGKEDAMPSIDPNYQQQQQQFFYAKGLERAKNAQREGKRSRIPLALVVGGTLVLALLLFLFLSGALSRSGAHYLMVDGIRYRVEEGAVRVSLEEGFTQAGQLFLSEDWMNSSENYATDWPGESPVWVNPADRSKVYIRWGGHWLECPRVRGLFSGRT